MFPKHTRVYRWWIVTEKVGRGYETYVYSIRTKRTRVISTASSKTEAVEDHQRLVDVVTDVIDQRARRIAESVPGQLSLVWE